MATSVQIRPTMRCKPWIVPLLFDFATTGQTAAWLAQLVGRQSAVREVEGSSPRPDQHSGS